MVKLKTLGLLRPVKRDRERDLHTNCCFCFFGWLLLHRQILCSNTHPIGTQRKENNKQLQMYHWKSTSIRNSAHWQSQTCCMLYPVCFFVQFLRVPLWNPNIWSQTSLPAVQKAAALFGDTSGIRLTAEASKLHISSGAVKKSISQMVTLFAQKQRHPPGFLSTELYPWPS